MYRGTLEEGGIGPGWMLLGFVRRMYRGTPGEEGIAPGVDAVVDVFEILRGGCG